MNLVFVWAEEGSELNVEVPIVFKGEDVCPGLKKGNFRYLFFFLFASFKFFIFADFSFRCTLWQSCTLGLYVKDSMLLLILIENEKMWDLWIITLFYWV